MPTLPTVVRALKHRDYRLFFGGQLVSLIGTWMQSVAQPWLIYRLTGSPTLLGLAGFAGQIPVLLLAPIGGAIADRHDRHRIIVGTQTVAMLQAFTMAALTLTGRVQVWHVFVLAAVLGVVYAFDIPARQSFIVKMVGPGDLSNAIALNSSIVNGARVIGPAIAGMLLATIGEGWCFLLNAISYLAVLLGLLMMRTRSQPAESVRGSAWSSIVDGFSYVWRTAPIRDLLLLLGLISITGVPYTVLMPIFADRILHGGATAYGTLMAMSGAGALAGALVLASRASVAGLGRAIAATSAGFGVALVLFSQSTQFWLSAALLFPVGFCWMVQAAATNTLVQSMVPDTYRGRVMAVYSMMLMGVAPIGALLAGALADPIGAPATVTVGGLLTVGAAAVFAWRLRAIRPEARQLLEEQRARLSSPGT